MRQSSKFRRRLVKPFFKDAIKLGDAPNREFPLPEPGYMGFYDNFIPGLKDGDYKVKVTHSVPDVAGATDTFSQFFTVQGPRFALPLEDIHAMQPPPGSSGQFDTHLPSIVINKKTFPWEKVLTDAKESKVSVPIPWVALLVFTEDELIVSSTTEPQSTKTVTSTVEKFLASESGVSKPTLSSVSHEEKNLSCASIKITKETFNCIAPRLSELKYLSHCRAINTGGKEKVEMQDEGWFSVVLANRFPQAPATENRLPQKNIVHLVSLEGCEGYLNNPDSLQPYIQLISLASWSFNCLLTPQENFGQLMEQIAAPTDLSLHLPLPADEKDSPAPTELKEQLQMGYSPLLYRLPTGEQTMAWYRGPFVPRPIKPSDALFNNSQECFDLLIYDADNGVFDVSYATAWQLGRSLALADQDFARTLMDFRYAFHHQVTQHAVQSKLAQENKEYNALIESKRSTVTLPTAQAIFCDQLRGGILQYLQKKMSEPVVESKVSEAPASSLKHQARRPARLLDVQTQLTIANSLLASEAKPAALDRILEWLLNLRILNGVPFYYFIANEQLLPMESIRFFHVDLNWLNALTQGALSIGVHASKDIEYNKLIKAELDKAKAQHPDPITGFLLRSTIVSGWPTLLVRTKEKFSDDKTNPDIIRIERLAPNILLCLFSTPPQMVILSEPHEQLSFGVEGDSLMNGVVDLRYVSGADIGTSIKEKEQERKPISVKDILRTGTRVLDVSKIVGCDLSLMSVKDEKQIDQSILTESQQKGIPILIQKGNEYLIYGDSKGDRNWGFTKITSDISHLEDLPFANRILRRSDEKFTASLINTLKEGHTPLAPSFSLILSPATFAIQLVRKPEEAVFQENHNFLEEKAALLNVNSPSDEFDLNITSNPIRVLVDQPVELIVTVTNKIKKDVTLKEMIIEVPVGDYASMLTSDAGNIGYKIQSDPKDWQISRNAERVKITSAKGQLFPQNADPLVIVLPITRVNHKVGPCNIRIVTKAKAKEDKDFKTAMDERQVFKNYSDFNLNNFQVNKAEVDLGEGVRLSWHRTLVEGCEITLSAGCLPKEGVKVTDYETYPFPGQDPLELKQTATFTLKAVVSKGGDTYDFPPLQVTVSVRRPGIKNFTPDREPSVILGESIKLFLEAEYVSTCKLTAPYVEPMEGKWESDTKSNRKCTFSVKPVRTTTYTARVYDEKSRFVEQSLPLTVYVYSEYCDFKQKWKIPGIQTLNSYTKTCVADSNCQLYVLTEAIDKTYRICAIDTRDEKNTKTIFEYPIPLMPENHGRFDDPPEPSLALNSENPSKLYVATKRTIYTFNINDKSLIDCLELPRPGKDRLGSSIVAFAISSDGSRLYVIDSEEIYSINALTSAQKSPHTAVDYISMRHHVYGHPSSTSIPLYVYSAQTIMHPDGSKFYILFRSAAHSLSALDVLYVVDTQSLKMERLFEGRLWHLALAKGLLYMRTYTCDSHNLGKLVEHGVTVFNTMTKEIKKITTKIDQGYDRSAGGLAVDLDGKKIYVAIEDRIIIIDIPSNEVIQDVSLGKRVTNITIIPHVDLPKLSVGIKDTNEIWVYPIRAFIPENALNASRLESKEAVPASLIRTSIFAYIGNDKSKPVFLHCDDRKRQALIDRFNRFAFFDSREKSNPVFQHNSAKSEKQPTKEVVASHFQAPASFRHFVT